MTQNQTKDVAIAQPQQTQAIYIPTEQDWGFMIKWGQQAIRSGMLPAAIKSPEAAAIIILKGRELGISFMTAVSNIHIITGKPTMSAELIQGLARKNLPGLVINILQSDSKIAKIEFIRPERGAKPFIQSFSWEDAERAKLTSKDVWKGYPAAMLWSRCVTAGLRKVCPEALMGISYTPEELGKDIDQDGNIIETTGRTLDEPKSAEVSKPIEAVASSQVTEPDPTVIAGKAVTSQIKQLKQELELSDEELKQEIHRQFGTDDYTKLTLEQREKIRDTMINEKEARAKEAPVIITPKSSEPEPKDSFNNFL